MNWLDIVILILLVVPTLIGLKIGIIKAVMSIAGVIIGVLLAGRFYEENAEALQDQVVSCFLHQLYPGCIRRTSQMVCTLLTYGSGICR